MERNLYAPPPLLLPTRSRPVAPQPLEVVWALRLLWTSLAVGIVTALAPVLLQISVGLLIYFIIVGAARYVISIWIIMRIRGGHNWAAYPLFHRACGRPWLYRIQLAAGISAVARWQTASGRSSGGDQIAPGHRRACLLLMPRASRWFKPPRIGR